MAISPTPSLASASSSLKLDDLLRVLLTELTSQNPLKPVENKDFLGQIAQFASLDSSQRLNGNIEQLLTLQAVNQTVGLIGRTVSATTTNGTVNGTVEAVSLANGAPRLTIRDGQGTVFVDIAIGQLETIRNLPGLPLASPLAPQGSTP